MSPSRTPLVRLGHIRDEIADLALALQGVTFDAFVESYVLRRTTEHAILIISEAARALSPSVTDTYAGIDWQAIRKIGSVLRHDYFAVDPKVLWLVVSERLPELQLVVDRMIEDQKNST